MEHRNLNHDFDSRQEATELIHLCLLTPSDVVHVRTKVLGYASKGNIVTRSMVTRLFSKRHFVMPAPYYLHEISSGEPIRFYNHPSPRSTNLEGSSAGPSASISQTGTGQMDHLASFFTRSLINTPHQEQTVTSIYLLRDIQELSDWWRAPERYKLGYLAPSPFFLGTYTPRPPSLRGILA